MKWTSRRPFTLIEVMICLALMAMLGGALAMKSSKLLSGHRTQNELAKLKSELRHAQHLSRSMQADIVVYLTQTDGGVEFKRLTDEPGIQKQMIKTFPHLKLPEETIEIHYAGNGYIFPDIPIVSPERRSEKFMM